MSTHPISILIVEDHPQLLKQITQAFRKKYRVDYSTTLAGAFNYIAETNTPYDLIIIDYQLPDGSGLELIPFIQQDSQTTRICVLTQQCSETTQMHALELGADTYLQKPLSLKTLMLHIQALLRRGKKQNTGNLSFADMYFNYQKRIATRNNTKVRLSNRESEFLKMFIRSLDGLVSQEELYRIYWEQGNEKITKSAIHVTIQRLRKKLEPLRIRIESIYGLGYQLTI